MDKFSLLIGSQQGELIVTTVSITVIFMCICILIMSVYLDKRTLKMSQNLCYQKELFHVLGSNVDNVFIIFNVINMEYEYISPNFEKSLGVSNEKLINNYLDLLEHVPDDARNKIINIISSPTISEIVEVEFGYIHPSTERSKHINIRLYPVFNQHRLYRFVACITDVTLEREAKKALDEAMDKLKEANEAKKEFLSHISHELKTPINQIIGMANIASGSLCDQGKVEHCLEQINVSSNRLLTMINNILDSSKKDHDKLTLVQVPFRINELVTKFSDIAKMQAELNHQVFSYDFGSFIDNNLIGDEMRTLQILINCMSNSLKFTPFGGKIHFEVTETERSDKKATFRFIITDTGKGMSKEFMEHLFDPYEQEDISIPQMYGGTGLGMSITHSLLSLLGGSIHVDSKPNEGTKITIDISYQINPILSESDTVIEKQSDWDYNYSNKRILVVEDNEINQKIVCEILKNIKVKTDVASDGYEAIRLFECSTEGYYDIILMDLIMPGMDGYETTKAIRNSSHPDANKVFIITMTADNFAEHSRSLACGMDYHMTKPFELNKFYEIINRVLETREKGE